MRKYALVLALLFAAQFYVIHICHIDGRWLLMDTAKANESDRGFTNDTILPADTWPDGGTPVPSEPTVFEGVTKKVINKSLEGKYDIRMYYPSFGNGELDASIEAWATEYCDDFMKDALDDYENLREAYFMWNMIATYSITKAGPNAVSLLFRIYVYTGGAHGGFVYIAHTFDANTWKEIPHERFFTEQKGALAVLSEYCRAHFAKMEEFANDEGVLEGTEPTPENFDIIVPRPGGLLVVFYPGQVSCNAAGTQTVFVPLEKFRKYIEPGRIWQ